MKFSFKTKTYPLLELCIRVHSRILDCRQECKRLWYLLRGLDEDGSGYAAVHIQQVCEEYLGCSQATFYKMLKQGMGIWFRGYTKGAGVVRIWYRATERVCADLGIERLGAVAYTDSECLTRAGAKGTATALDAQLKQRQAYWAAKQDSGNKQVQKPWKRVSSDNSAGAKYALSWGNSVLPGTSLAGIAKDTEFTAQTIRRRLDNRWRHKRGLFFIKKKRAAHRVSRGAWLDIPPSGFLVEDGKVYRLLMIKSSKDNDPSGLYRLGTNLYGEEHKLSSARFIRSKVSKAVKKAQGAVEASILASCSSIEDLIEVFDTAIEEGDHEKHQKLLAEICNLPSAR